MEEVAVLKRNSSSATMKQRFDEELSKIRVKAAKNSVFLTETAYRKLINDVQVAKTTNKKKPRDYWLLNRYDVMTVENKSKLIYPVKKGVSSIQYYLADSELFDVLHKAHLAIGHGGRDRMLKELSTKYKNVTRHDIELYIHLCDHCQKRQKGTKREIVVKPTILSEFNSRCRLDLIDYQSQPDREYKFVMVYQDHLTKFVILKSLKSNRAEEVAYNLADIFSLLGAPSIIQSDSEMEFVSDVVTRLKELWPGLKIVHGKPRSVERVDQDIENMLRTWMQDKESDRWSEGVRFVQFMKNGEYHSGIKKTPYEALFGCKSKLGITTSFLSEDVWKDINTEEQLEEVIANIQTKEKGETNQIIQEKESVLQKTEESGLNKREEDMITEETFVSDTSCVCSKETCGAVSDDNKTDIMCRPCIKTENAIEGQVDPETQAKKMKMNPEIEFKTVSTGTNVRVPVADVDEERGDSANWPIPLRSVTTAQCGGSDEATVKCRCRRKCQKTKCHSTLQCCNKWPRRILRPAQADDTLVNVHTMLKTPVLVRSPKLSSIGRGQYLDG